jgi:hypothetical protein
MLLVAGSGIIGRFIYVRIYDGLSNKESRLDELESSESKQALNFNRDMHWAPDVVKTLTDFRVWAGQPAANRAAGTHKFLTLPLREWSVRRECHRLLAVQLDIRGELRNWDARKRALRALQFDKLIRQYTTTVKRRAQLDVYKRLFSWWHILHLPFVWLLGASAIYHVVAVHMY